MSARAPAQPSLTQTFSVSGTNPVIQQMQFPGRPGVIQTVIVVNPTNCMVGVCVNDPACQMPPTFTVAPFGTATLPFQPAYDVGFLFTPPPNGPMSGNVICTISQDFVGAQLSGNILGLNNQNTIILPQELDLIPLRSLAGVVDVFSAIVDTTGYSQFDLYLFIDNLQDSTAKLIVHYINSFGVVSFQTEFDTPSPQGFNFTKIFSFYEGSANGPVYPRIQVEFTIVGVNAGSHFAVFAMLRP